MVALAEQMVVNMNNEQGSSVNAGGLFIVFSLQNQLARQNVYLFSNHTNTKSQ
jgi:hypothetical protein